VIAIPNRTLINCALGLAAAAGAIGLQLDRLDRLDRPADYQLEAETTATRLAVTQQSPTLGFSALAADWTLLEYLQYFGDDEAREVTGYELADNYLDRVTELDPRFFYAYIFVSPGVSYYQGQPERSIELFDRGVENLSPELHENAFAVPKFEALDRFLLLGDVPGAIEAYEVAIDWLDGTPYAEYKGSLEQTVEFLKTNADSTQARYVGWLDVYSSATDPLVRERAADELRSLGAREVEREDGSTGFAPPEF